MKENGKQWKHVILRQSQSQTQQSFFSVATCPTKAVHLLWPFQGFDGGHGMQALLRKDDAPASDSRHAEQNLQSDEKSAFCGKCSALWVNK